LQNVEIIASKSCHHGYSRGELLGSCGLFDLNKD